jgi:hypothetical protein
VGAVDRGGRWPAPRLTESFRTFCGSSSHLGVIPVAVHASAVGWTPNFSKKARIEASASSSRSSEESRSSYGGSVEYAGWVRYNRPPKSSQRMVPVKFAVK